MKRCHVCLSVVLLTLRVRSGVLLAGGVLVCRQRVHEKKTARGRKKKGGEKKRESFAITFFSDTLQPSLLCLYLQVASTCCGLP